MFKKNDDSLKRNLDKETKNADDDEYTDNPPLKLTISNQLILL